MEKLIRNLETLYGANIEEFSSMAWNALSDVNMLTEDFIRKYKDKVNWFHISLSQSLSEAFILEFEDKVDWLCISRYKKLSYPFVMEHLDKLHLYSVLQNDLIEMTDEERENLITMETYRNIFSKK